MVTKVATVTLSRNEINRLSRKGYIMADLGDELDTFVVIGSIKGIEQFKEDVKDMNGMEVLNEECQDTDI